MTVQLLSLAVRDDDDPISERTVPAGPAAAHLLPVEICRRFHVLPVEFSDGVITLVAPGDEQPTEDATAQAGPTDADAGQQGSRESAASSGAATGLRAPIMPPMGVLAPSTITTPSSLIVRGSFCTFGRLLQPES